MQKPWLKIIALLIALLLVSNLKAHVELDFPVGGETFFVGDTVYVEWHKLINHNQNNWDLYFSPDGGGIWQSIQLDLPISQNNYQWVVPNIFTDRAQIRIRMDNIGDNYEDMSSTFTIAERVLEVEKQAEYPTIINLISNFPNPFNSSTTIKYEISQPSQVEVMIYDMLGKEIIQLYYGIKEAGVHSIGWHGFDNLGNPVSAGIYLYQIHAGQFIQSRKMVLLK